MWVIADMAVITAFSHVFSAAATRLRQPAVTGQILAGILLGPSLLGRLPGHPDAKVFPPAMLPYVNVVAQVGLVLFMYCVGYELDVRLLRGRLRSVAMVSAVSLLLPMALGAGAALTFLRQGPGGRAHAAPFVLFMAIAVSITAVPVLARVIREWGLGVTVPGTVSMAAAAVMDVAGWLLLAVAVMGGSRTGDFPVPDTALLFVLYLAGMLLLVRPALRRLLPGDGAEGPARLLPIVIALAMGSAWVTGALGLNVIFGAFLAGLLTPRRPDGAPDPGLLHPVEQAGNLLLPLFFVVTGLSVDIGALRPGDILPEAGICAIAIAGKVGGGLLGSRLARLPLRESAVIGALLNTRGLTELIALNVGRQAGLVDARVYTMLVLMALITTAMTGPLLHALKAPRLVASRVREAVSPAAALGAARD